MESHTTPGTGKGRYRIFGAGVSFVIPFCVYLYFLCPTIAAGDTTELINAAATLGIPHAPGYPLFTMLGHVFSWIPFNSVAWRINLSSAVFSALACLFVYLSVFRLTQRVWAGLAAALGLGFSRFFWHYAEVAEVFALNSLFVALISYFLVRFKGSIEGGAERRQGKAALILSRPSRRLFWVLCFVCGLALTNHHTIVLLAPGVLLFFLLSCPAIFREAKTMAVGIGLFLLGFLPYVYCPLAAMTDPLLNWDDPVNLENFLQLLLRKDFGTFSLTAMEESGTRWLQVKSYAAGLYQQFTPLGLALAVIGLLQIKDNRAFTVYLIVSFLFSGLFFVLFANYPLHRPLLLGVLQRFYIMSAVLFSFWIGLGVKRVLVWTERKHVGPYLRSGVPLLVAACLVLWQFATNVHEANFRDNYMAKDYIHNLLLCLPENSLFFARGDVSSMGLNYFQAVLGKRRDVVVLDQEKMTYPWYYRQMKERYPDIVLRGNRYDGVKVLNLHLISDNVDRRDVFFRDFKEDSYAKEFQAVWVGLAKRVVPKSVSYPLERVEKRLNLSYEQFKKRGWRDHWPATSFERVIMSSYAEPIANVAYECRVLGNKKAAVRYYRRALVLDPDHYMSLKNLALLLLKKGQVREAADLFERYLELKPDDKESDEIRKVIETYGPSV